MLTINSNDSDIAMFTYQLLGILYDTCEKLTEERKDFEIRALRAENEAAKYKDRWETSRKDFERLADENERLRAEVADLRDELKCEKETNEHLCGEYMSAKADTVKKTLQRIKEDAIAVSLLSNPPKFMLEIREDALDQIAKELTDGL